jgi:aspartate racemase
LTTSELLFDLVDRGVQLWPQDSKLKFRAPRGVMTEELLALLKEHKSGLLELIGEGRKVAVASFNQQRLWFLERLAEDEPLYNMAEGALRLSGPLDVEALRKALEEIQQRHEALRTLFMELEGRLLQVILLKPDLDFRIVDFSNLPPDEKEEKARASAQEELRFRFDLIRGPLFKVVLYKLAEDDHLLLLPTHHIISDGWSMGVLLRELSLLYAANETGRPMALKELPIQYADWALAQRQSMDAIIARDSVFWEAHLSGEIPALELPTDRPRPVRPTYRAARLTRKLPRELVERARSLGRERNATLFMTLYAVFDALLFRYTGQEDFVVGTVTANRTQPDYEDLMGFFVNTLALRGRPSATITFSSFLEQIRKTVLDAFSHQETPFDRVVDIVQPARGGNRNPLAQVLFVLESMPLPSMEMGNCKMAFEEFSTGALEFDIVVTLMEANGDLNFSVAYDRELFDADRIERMIRHYGTLLESAIQNPENALGELPLLSGDEPRLIAEWNGAERPYPRDASLAELFEEQVAINPDSVALRFGEEQVSYAKLNAYANRLARRLIELGVGPEVPVGLCLERGVDMVALTLAIVKAGGAYVPFDADIPAARVAHILGDSLAPLTIIRAEEGAKLPPVDTTCYLPFDELISTGNSDCGNPPCSVSASNMAYVMYTSGSTGKPKGVCVEQRNIIRLVKNPDYAKMEGETFLQFAPISFDAATLEIWGPLLNGGTLVIPPPGPTSLDELGDIIEKYEITTLWLTSGLFHQMVEHRLSSMKGVRQLMSGGDVLSVSHVRRVLENLPQTVMINGYGPTENTTFTCCNPLRPGDEIGNNVSIGRPIANTRVYILDGAMAPAPIGIWGELYAGGDGVARGYLNAPDLTVERFLPDPFNKTPSARMYKTGDIVRWLPNGKIEFLGRRDNQIKLRGFRIELGEIEGLLNRFPGVAESVVIVREDVVGDKRLVAYVKAVKGETLDSKALLAFMREQLPNYMTPSSVVVMGEFPLTQNGKIDRRALPKPDGDAAPSSQYEAPRDGTESRLAEIWNDLLRVERVGAKDSFFELGGHSLLAMTLMHRVEVAFGKRLPLASLFSAPTIREFAQLLGAETENVSGSSPVSLQLTGSYPPFFCVPGIRGEVFSLRSFADLLGVSQPFYALDLPDHDRMPKPLEEYAREFVAQVRNIQPRGPYYLGGMCFGGVIAYEMAQQLIAIGEEVAFLGLFESYAEGGRLSASEKFAWITHNLIRGRFYTTIRAGFLKLRILRQLIIENLFLAFAPKKRFEKRRMRYEARKDRRRRTRILYRYAPQPYSGQAFLFRAAEADDDFHHYAERANGWAVLCERPVKMFTYNCGHGDLLEEPFIHDVSRDVKKCFDALHRGCVM